MKAIKYWNQSSIVSLPSIHRNRVAYSSHVEYR